jgi:hypothetical protein
MMTAKAALRAIRGIVVRQCLLAAAAKIVIPVRNSIVKFSVNAISTIY